MKNALFFPIFTTILFNYFLMPTYGGFLRTATKTDEGNAATMRTHRELSWVFVSTGDVIDNNESYDFYDEAPKDSLFADKPDRLRTTDLCYKDGTYSFSNCPTPPDCNWSGKFGPAKLCINRAPRPDWVFYVAIMKCIPAWENCDKCLCGSMSSERDDSLCVPQSECPPNDDTLRFSCSDRSKIKFQGHSWQVPDSTAILADTSKPTPMPTTKQPTRMPTTKSPTQLPTTKSPTIVPTTKSPTPLPTTKTPTLMPTTKPPTQLTTTKSPTITIVPTTEQPTLMPTTKTPTTTTKSPTIAPTTQPPTVETNATLFFTPQPSSNSVLQLFNYTVTEGIYGTHIVVESRNGGDA